MRRTLHCTLKNGCVVSQLIEFILYTIVMQVLALMTCTPWDDSKTINNLQLKVKKERDFMEPLAKASA